MFDLEEGRVLICGSRINSNPNCRDPSTYEWYCEATNYCDFNVERNSSRRRRQIDSDVVFISIEGVEESNEVNVEVVMGDQTISNGT